MIHLDRPPTGVPSLPTTVLETLAEYLGAYDLRYPRLPVDVFWEPNGAGTGAWCNWAHTVPVLSAAGLVEPPAAASAALVAANLHRRSRSRRRSPR